MYVPAVQHGARRYANSLEGVHQFITVDARGPALDDLIYLIVVLLPGEQVGVLGVCGQLRLAHQSAHAGPTFIVAHRQCDPLVITQRRVAALGRTVGMAVTDAAALTAVHLGVHDVLGHEHDAGLVHTDIGPLALACLVAVTER